MTPPTQKMPPRYEIVRETDKAGLGRFLEEHEAVGYDIALSFVDREVIELLATRANNLEKLEFWKNDACLTELLTREDAAYRNSLRAVRLYRTYLGDLRSPITLPELRAVRIDAAEIDGEAVRCFASAPKLCFLHVSNDRDSVAYRAVYDFPRLDSVILGRSDDRQPVQVEEIVRFVRSNAGLRVVDLDITGMRHDTIRALFEAVGRYSNIEILRIYSYEFVALGVLWHAFRRNHSLRRIGLTLSYEVGHGSYEMKSGYVRRVLKRVIPSDDVVSLIESYVRHV